MSNNFDLDQYEKFTVTIKGKEYEVMPMNFENLKKVEKLAEKWDKIKPTKDDNVGIKQMIGILRQMFVTQPSEEIMMDLNAVQAAQLFRHIWGLAVGTATVLPEKKS